MATAKNKHIQSYFFFALIGIIFIINIFVFAPFLNILSVVAVITVVFYPLFRKLKKLLFKNGNLSAVLTLLIVLLIVLIPLVFFSLEVFYEVKGIYTNMSSVSHDLGVVSSNVEAKMARFLPNASFDLESYVSNIFGNVATSLGAIFSSAFSFITVVLLGLVAMFFFLRDGGKFIEKLMQISPLEDSHNEKILLKLKQTINSVVKGSLVVALLQGILAWFGLMIFGVPNPALWGSVSIFASLVPGIGTAIIMIPAIVYLFYTSTLFNTIGLLLWALVVVGLVDNAIRPFFVSKAVDIHPFMVLLSILGGFMFFGPIGFLMGPLMLSFFSVLTEIYPSIVKK